MRNACLKSSHGTVVPFSNVSARPCDSGLHGRAIVRVLAVVNDFPLLCGIENTGLPQHDRCRASYADAGQGPRRPRRQETLLASGALVGSQRRSRAVSLKVALGCIRRRCIARCSTVPARGPKDRRRPMNRAPDAGGHAARASRSRARRLRNPRPSTRRRIGNPDVDLCPAASALTHPAHATRAPRKIEQVVLTRSCSKYRRADGAPSRSNLVAGAPRATTSPTRTLAGRGARGAARLAEAWLRALPPMTSASSLEGVALASGDARARKARLQTIAFGHEPARLQELGMLVQTLDRAATKRS